MDAADTAPLDNSGGAWPLPDVSDNSSRWGSSGSMAAPIIVSIFLPVLLTWAIKKKTEKVKPAAVQAKVGGAAGYAVRNQRFLSLLETPWEGANTITALFEQSCIENSAQNLLGTRVLEKRETIVSSGGRPFEKLTLGNYVWITYGDSFKRVVNFSAGLVAIGHAEGERVAIFSETCAEWFIALQACFRRNATVVTIYASLGDEALVHSLNETEATTVICDVEQLNKLIGMRKQLESLKRVVYIENEDVKSKQTDGEFAILSLTKVESLGEDNSVEPNLPQPSDVAVIMYTSGSTGLPKGVMITHANIVATIAGVSTAVPNLGTKDVYLAYLPLAHILELVAEVTICAGGASIGYGSPLTLTDTSNKVKKGTKGDATQLQPTLMTAVPAILDRVRDGVRKTVDAKGGFTKKLFDLAYNRRLAAMEGSWLGAVGPEKLFWDTLVFKKIRSVLGGRIRGVLSGGAPLSGDTQRFINICFGAPVGQGYGLTETCACGTFSDWKDTSVGRVGPPVPSNYIKLVDWDEGNYRTSDSPMPRGEIVLGGPSVTLGYFKNEAKTDEVYKLDETGMRWFFTGDIGKLHADGCLEIIDRKKDIVKLQHGEYVSLGKVEAVLAGSQYVDGVMIHADPFHSYTVALVVPKQGALESWAQNASLSFDGFTDLVEKKEAASEVQADISKVGKQGRLEKWEIPSKVKLFSEAWTPESGLVTAALKIKRENIKKRFGEDLKKLYA